MLCKSLATSIIRKGYDSNGYFIFDAQDQLNRHARSEDVDLRNSGELGAMASNPAPLSLCSLSGTQPELEHCRDGGDAFRHSDFLDI